MTVFVVDRARINQNAKYNNQIKPENFPLLSIITWRGCRQGYFYNELEIKIDLHHTREFSKIQLWTYLIILNYLNRGMQLFRKLFLTKPIRIHIWNIIHLFEN